MLIAIAGSMTNTCGLVAVLLSADFTCTVKVLLPAVVGVPDMIPLLLLRLSPAGRVPVVMLQV